MNPETPPSPEELARELERVRAEQPSPVATPPGPSVAELLKKRVLRAVVLWAALIVAFLVIWFVLNPGK